MCSPLCNIYVSLFPYCVSHLLSGSRLPLSARAAIEAVINDGPTGLHIWVCGHQEYMEPIYRNWLTKVRRCGIINLSAITKQAIKEMKVEETAAPAAKKIYV